jgi:hypothetical protein
MSGDGFEYAIKKDIRNNPIVREFDRERDRELWRTVYVGLFLVAVFVFYVWRLFLGVHYGYGLVDLEAERKVQERLSTQLQSKLQYLRSPARIEPIARDRLQMVEPRPEDRREIVRPGAPPPRTAIAQR